MLLISLVLFIANNKLHFIQVIRNCPSSSINKSNAALIMHPTVLDFVNEKLSFLSCIQKSM